MMANKTDLSATPNAPVKPTALTIKTLSHTAKSMDEEPIDTNTTEPNTSAEQAPSSVAMTPSLASATPSTALYVAPPALSHINTSARRQSNSAPSLTPATATGMTDISLADSSPSVLTATASAKSSVDNPAMVLSPAGSSSMMAPSLKPKTTHFSSMPRNATTEVNFDLESPSLGIEMERFTNDSGFNPDAIEHWMEPDSPVTARPTTTSSSSSSSSSSSFFTGFFAIPPSLAGRPKLTKESENYIRREFERGPVPLMWPKENDIENPVANNNNTFASATTMNSGITTPQLAHMGSAQAGTGSVTGWFHGWWGVKTVTTPSDVSAVDVPVSSEVRREGTMAR
ncbi:hypothetical protein EDD11_005581 [Mortierella claussenii]|nr:hypothetical protein EDD11_005581 [Mortierella claussenii]